MSWVMVWRHLALMFLEYFKDLSNLANHEKSLQVKLSYTGFLVSAGTELNFFMVCGMILCFGNRRKIMLISQWCFRWCWAVLHTAKDVSVFSFLCCSAREGLGDTRSWEGQSQDICPKLTKRKFHSLWHYMRKKNYRTGGSWMKVLPLLGLAGYWLTSGEQLHCALLVCI